MKKFVTAAVMAVMAAGLARADSESHGNVCVPPDGMAFKVTENDVVRFTGAAPGSTGFRTTVKVTEGDANVIERPVFSVVNGKPITIGGGRWNSTSSHRKARKVRSK